MPVNTRFRTDAGALISQTVTFPTNNQSVNIATVQIRGTGKDVARQRQGLPELTTSYLSLLLNQKTIIFHRIKWFLVLNPQVPQYPACIDKTSPSISGSEIQKVYDCNARITFCDNVTGVKSAAQNANNFVSVTMLTENGDYMLAVLYYGDNKAKINFKIQK